MNYKRTWMIYKHFERKLLSYRKYFQDESIFIYLKSKQNLAGESYIWLQITTKNKIKNFVYQKTMPGQWR